MASRFPCLNKINHFCYVCGKYEAKKGLRQITDGLQDKYAECFGKCMKHLDKPWTPDNICNSCRVMLNRFNKKNCITKAVIEPVVWREPSDHSNDCFFVRVKLQDTIRKIKKK